MISSFGDVVELNDGSFLVKNYGKYESGLGIIVRNNDNDAVFRNKNDNSKGYIDLFRTSFEGSRFNLGNVCVLSGIVGDFFVSKKGTKLFKKSENGKHILLRDNWEVRLTPIEEEHCLIQMKDHFTIDVHRQMEADLVMITV